MKGFIKALSIFYALMAIAVAIAVQPIPAKTGPDMLTKLQVVIFWPKAALMYLPEEQDGE
ncbi:hypothetical protein [Halovulum sp. GXIMD14793]